MDPKLLADRSTAPFYSWECLTLQLKNRDVDLVIPKESQMMMLIKYIMYKINSVDGTRNTAEPMFKNLYNKCVKQCNKDQLTDKRYMQQIKDQIQF